MANRSDSDRSPKPSQLSEAREGKLDNSASGQGKGSGPSKLLWPVLFGLTLAFVTWGLIFLWPIFRLGGVGFAIVMVVAVLASSLTPLLLVRKSFAMPSSRRGKKSHEDEQIL